MQAADQGETGCRMGVLAFGDSITNGGGELQWGVALQSWAWWLARGLGLPFTSYAVDGANAAHVRRLQIPAFQHTAARPDAGYDVGCIYIGVNDVRALNWNPASFESDFGAALELLTGRCERILALTAPIDVGRPRAGGKVLELNGAIRLLASRHGALVVDLSDFGARNLVMTDHVHPTAFGQIAIAQRALAVLARHGCPTRVPPSSLISYETTRWKRLRGDATYAYRHAQVSARALALRAASFRASS